MDYKICIIASPIQYNNIALWVTDGMRIIFPILNEAFVSLYKHKYYIFFHDFCHYI